MKFALPKLRLVVWSLLVVGLCVVPASADDLVFYSGGKTFSIERSSTEYAVVMPPAEFTAARAKIASEPGLAIEPLPWARHRPGCGIVRIPEATEDPLAAVRNLVGDGEIRRVFRIEGIDQPVLGSGNVILRFDERLSDQERAQLFRDFRVNVVREIDAANGVFLVRPQGDPQEGDLDIRTAAAMSRDDRTAYAMPDLVIPAEPKQVLGQVEDEFFERQWHLNNVGQELGTPGADINIEGAWEITFGEDVLIGMFDDSCDVQHEDLAPNYTNVGQDPATGEESPDAPEPVSPNDRHGTTVMGLIVGAANELGVRGVAPASRFTASRGLNDITLSLSQVASTFTFARQQDVDVHNNSWGYPFATNSQVQPVVDGIRTSFETGRGDRGMVILFAAGNSGEELTTDDDLSTLAEVIGVAATNADDVLASYSNYGRDIDICAPSGDVFLPKLVTTDVDDEAGYPSIGYNDGSGTDVFGVPDLSDFRYTKNFSGTSGACPVASGVAALILSQNQELTAEQVRTIMVHTAVKVDPQNAAYHPITERSLRYGYGRLDASAAVEAAMQSAENDGFTWPEPLSNAEIRGNVLTWTVGDSIREIDADDDPNTDPDRLGDRTVRTLVLESSSPFSANNAFIPEDGELFNVGEEVMPSIVVVQNNANTNFTLPAGESKRYYALFPANAIGRYGFGVTIDTDGNVEGISGAPGGDGPSQVEFIKPAVSISVSPLLGTSPLQVTFKGNALSGRTLESFTWEFDDGDTAERNQATHVYEVAPDETRRFFPSFTVVDDLGNIGRRTVAVDVRGTDTTAEDGADANLLILVSRPGSSGSNITRGVSPLSVELTISGTLANDNIESVEWDLGDGSTANTITVPHTYINETAVPQTLPISVNLTTRDPNGQLVTQSATRFLTVDPGSTGSPIESPADGTGDNADSDGGASPAGRIAPDLCGTGSPLALIGLIIFAFVRRHLR